MGDYKKDLGWSSTILDYICSEEEAEIYSKAGLKEAIIRGKPALIRQDINWADYSIKRNTWLRDRLSDYDKWAKYNNADLIGEGFLLGILTVIRMSFIILVKDKILLLLN